MKQAIRPAIFKWRQTEPALILCAVRWYLRYSLSFRDVEELLRERGLEADHTTIWRWVQHYGPELEERLRRHLKPTNKSWRVDETCVRVKGRWCSLYRALDSTGAMIDFVLSGWREALVRGCGQADALHTVEPVTYRCGTRRVCQARSSGSARDTRARPHAVAPMNYVPEDSRRRSTCTGRTHAPRARADGNQRWIQPVDATVAASVSAGVR